MVLIWLEKIIMKSAMSLLVLYKPVQTKTSTILVNHNVIPMSLLKNSAILSITISK